MPPTRDRNDDEDDRKRLILEEYSSWQEYKRVILGDIDRLNKGIVKLDADAVELRIKVSRLTDIAENVQVKIDSMSDTMEKFVKKEEFAPYKKGAGLIVTMVCVAFLSALIAAVWNKQAQFPPSPPPFSSQGEKK